MRVMLLGDCNSIHIIKWVKALCGQNIEIALFSLSKLEHEHFEQLQNFTLSNLEMESSIHRSGEGSPRKLSYLKALPLLKRLIIAFKPDILHAHYASSYGLIGTLSKFNPFIISVWGSDIYDFPRKNWIFKKLIQLNLRSADKILSTSETMARETKKYTKKTPIVTPFGVSTKQFKKISQQQDNAFVIGTIKALYHKYGIDVLIESFAKLKEKNPESALELHIIGDGPDKAKLQKLSEALNVESSVKFLGQIDNKDVPQYLNTFDIYAALSRWDSESFGVAIVEAQACEVPVVVSNKGGLPEVVEHMHTGIVVESENADAACEAFDQLLHNKQKASSMGIAGRKRVEKLYDWEQNVQHMIAIYLEIISGKV